MRRSIAIPALMLTAAFACGKDEPKPAAGLTERQRDSVIGASQLPGAQGVRGALRVSDSADARSARYDSVSR